ncbi:MHYT domain-containing protein [Noviherbaspirillum aridicola]|uniref:histidine kinase n=1 Tax=Noviherbaspirillum aridicola TaxID=2849687 RepID=A0ABQ4PZT7_9BURK|nr:MHYT domain-containing protein [Noviherbaspirillum aridicola]GIZ50427.1 hypothetical protein NCCP691_04410 [Noviherbaspirillum aridicola]
MPLSYHPWLVALSIGIAVLASYAALDLAGRVAAERGSRKAWAWLCGGALSMGGGIWSMHFVGMLAWRSPMPLAFDVGITLASLLLAIVASGFALYSVSRSTFSWRRLGWAGALMGIGIAGMHYVGMTAMRMDPPIRYDPVLFALSVAIAMAASMGALQMAWHLRGQTIRSAFWQKTGSALLMGAAIYGMHYTGMAAAIIAPGSVCTAGPQNISSNWLALSVAGFSFLFLLIAIGSALIDSHYEERRLRDALVRAYAERTRAILQTSHDAFIGIGPSGRIIDWNRQAERMFGWPREEALGRPVAELSSPGAPFGVLPPGLPGAEGSRFETTLRDSRGQDIPVEIALTALQGATHSEYFAFVRDISERRRAEQELHDANRRKDEFLAMLGHELRNPLAPISAAAEYLGLIGGGDPRLQHTSAVLARQAGHMRQLVDDLLDVARITRGTIALRKAPVDLRQVARNAVEQVAPLVEELGHRLDLRLPQEDALVAGDEKRLVQVASNLLGNAARYTQDGGEISLAVEVRPMEVVLSVSDNGIGLAPDLLPHVFDLFVQGRRSSDRAQGGLGLGLALVKNLVELHGGSVAADSEGPGRGSRFQVRLPRLTQPAAAQPGEPAQPSSAPAAGASPASLRVLVVDDNADAAQSLSALLQAQGHEVRTAHDAASGLACAIEWRPHAALLDIGLPEIDGYELARRMRRMPETAAAMLVAVTGYGQQKDREAAHAAGFNHHFVKPVDSAALAAVLAAAAAELRKLEGARLPA